MNPANRKASAAGLSAERLVPEYEKKRGLIQEHMARYAYASTFVIGKTVLDIACGTGYGAAMLKQAGAIAVHGVDNSPDAIHYARNRFSADGIVFQVGDAERVPLSGKFDVVVSFETIEHLRNPATFLEESVRLLSPNGVFIVSTTVRTLGTLETKPRNPHHVREWSVQEFEQLLSAYYGNVSIQGQYTFEKKWFPFSRRLQRMLYRRRFPAQVGEIDAMQVLPAPPKINEVRFSMVYVVAVCRHGR